MKVTGFFFLLSCIISWLIWLPLYLPALSDIHLKVMPLQHGFGSWGPLMSAVLTTAIFCPEKFKSFFSSFFVFTPVYLLLLSILLPVGFALLCVYIDALWIGCSISDALSGIRTGNEWGLLSFVLFNLISFGLGEEAGWRGFALPRLQKKFNALTASAILTVFWAFWHLPLFLYRPGYMQMDAIAIGGWILSLFTGSVLLSFFYNSSRGSIFICAVFHAMIDVIFTVEYTGKHVTSWLGILVTVSGLVLILIFKPGHLSRQPKIIA